MKCAKCRLYQKYRIVYALARSHKPMNITNCTVKSICMTIHVTAVFIMFTTHNCSLCQKELVPFFPYNTFLILHIHLDKKISCTIISVEGNCGGDRTLRF